MTPAQAAAQAEIQRNPPDEFTPADWNRYGFLLGMGQDSGSDTQEAA